MKGIPCQGSPCAKLEVECVGLGWSCGWGVGGGGLGRAPRGFPGTSNHP